MGLETYGESLALNAVLTGVYVALHTGAPTGANEVTGGSYARQALGAYTITGNNPSVASNNNIIQFPTATALWGEVTHVGIWSAAVGGSLIATQPLVTSKYVDIDDSFRFLATKLKVQVD